MNYDDVSKTLLLLRTHDEITEIRIPKTGWKGKDVFVGYFKDVEKCCKVVEKYSGVVPAIYTNLNPINSALLARSANRIDEKAGLAAQDTDVIKRSWIYIDIDPIRPAGISSTDNEHEAAITKAYEINRKQSEYGWNSGVVCDSGNGASLLFRIDLPNNENTTNLIKKVLVAFDFLYSDDKTQIDVSVFNAARIIKLYGTATKKGDNVPDRPHRTSKLLFVPEIINAITAEQLTEHIAKLPEDDLQPELGYTGGFDIQTWMKQYSLSVSKSKNWNGGTLYTLEECPFDSNHKSPDSCIIQAKSGVLVFKCLHNSCRKHNWHELRALKEPNRKERPKETVRIQPEQKPSNAQVIIEPPVIIEYSKIHFTDVSNAKRLVSIFGKDIRYVPLWKSWMHWTGQYWEKCEAGRQGYPKQLIICAEKTAARLRQEAGENEDSEYSARLYKHASASESWTRIKSMINLAEAEPGITMSPDGFDRNKFLFNVQNGTLDLLNRIFRDHMREDYITKISPIEYNESAKNPRWQAFLNRVMQGNPEMIAYLQNFAGQCLTGEVREKAMYVFWGSKGNNGKTTFIEQIQYILNQYAQSIPIDSLMKSENKRIPNDIAGLQGARFVYASEPELGDVLSEGMIKKLTGMNTIKARFLNQEFFQFMPEFKLVIETNNQPHIKVVDGGTWNRVKCIPWVEEIPEAEQDKSLRYKLQVEGSGVLNWMIEGCYAWLDGGMKIPEIVRQVTEDYKEDSDKFADFLNYAFVKDSQGFMASDILYILYKMWCSNNEQYPVASNTFSMMMKERGYQSMRGYLELSKEGNEKQPIDSAGQASTGTYQERTRVRGFAGIAGQTWLKESVQLILTTADSDYEQAKWLFGQVDRLKRDRCVLLNSCEGVLNHMSSMSSSTNRYGEVNTSILSSSFESVQSVQSVLNIESIIIKIKEAFAEKYKPTNIQEVNVLKEQVRGEVLSVTDQEDIDDEIIMKMITDYSKVLGYE